MNRLDLLRMNYLRVCGMPWDESVSGAQRVWIAVYDKQDERKLRSRLGLFEEGTRHAGHGWYSIDLTDAFPEWLCGEENSAYAAGYFDAPDLLDEAVLSNFKQTVIDSVGRALDSLPADAVLALYGIASLFGFARVSEILPQVELSIRGRLLIFFPGVYEQDNYRMLDAQDGWNYHAIPITGSESEVRR